MRLSTELGLTLFVGFLIGGLIATALLLADWIAVEQGYEGLVIVMAVGWVFGLAVTLVIRIRASDRDTEKLEIRMEAMNRRVSALETAVRAERMDRDTQRARALT
jgi:prepilin signal peptidase PulO-like enzyme (type II secretory pathway)